MPEANENGLIPVESSVTSVFYRRPSPGEDPFVEEGDQVNDESVVCLLEIMKCFRSVFAGANGTVEKILVENGAMVNKGDALMLIRPDK
jgi:acetyl-CoA carboxylase biotin carboxyl carrier protein